MAFDLEEKEGVEKEVDRIGGSYVWESGIYDCVVDMAYLEESAGGALGLHLTLVHNDRRLRESFYVTSGTAKGKKTTYSREGKEFYLPGFTMARNLCLTAAGMTLQEVAKAGEKKVINLYDRAQQKEVPTEKEFVLTALVGKDVKVGVIKDVVNRRQRNAEGKYVPINEKREENHISQFFYPTDDMTVNEKESGLTEADFINKWRAKNEGVDNVEYKEIPEHELPEAPAAGAANASNPFGA